MSIRLGRIGIGRKFVERIAQPLKAAFEIGHMEPRTQITRGVPDEALLGEFGWILERRWMMNRLDDVLLLEWRRLGDLGAGACRSDSKKESPERALRESGL